MSTDFKNFKRIESVESFPGSSEDFNRFQVIDFNGFQRCQEISNLILRYLIFKKLHKSLFCPYFSKFMPLLTLFWISKLSLIHCQKIANFSLP